MTIIRAFFKFILWLLSIPTLAALCAGVVILFFIIDLIEGCGEDMEYIERNWN